MRQTRMIISWYAARGLPRLRRGPGVGRSAPVRRGPGACLLGPRGYARVVPPPAAERHEQLAVLGRRPGGRLLRVDRVPGRQMVGQAHEAHVPADAHGTGSEFGPALVIDLGGVLKLERGRAVSLRVQPDLDPADLAPEFPGRPEALRWVAALDSAARIALDLEAAAKPQFAGDWQEPTGDAFRIGARVPEVVDAGLIGLADRHDPGLARRYNAGPAQPSHGADLVPEFDHGVLLPCRLFPELGGRRSRLPRTTSVSSASRRGVQVRRKRSSHASTSCSAAGLIAYMRLVPSG